MKTNRLWLARKRLGYEQKQVARLIGKTMPQISWWENGERVPHLKTALKFSIIYKLPVRILFPKYFQACQDEISRAAKDLGKSPWTIDLTEPADFCSYLEIINAGLINDIEKEKVRRHIKILMDQRRVNILDH